MRTRLQQRRADDSGVMLIVALVIITTVAVVTGALLTHGSTNFRATATLEGVAGTSYSADTAAKVALNNLRLGARAPGWVTPAFPGSWNDWVYTNNADGAGCFGADGLLPSNALELRNLYPKAGDQASASSTRVECSVVPGTGIFGAGGGVGIDDPDPTDAFARALTTVGTTGPWQGMVLKPLGTGNGAPMPIRGGIGSRSFITVDNGALVTDGYVKAQGACNGQIVSSPPPACNQPGSVPVPTTPPSPLTTVPAYRDPSTVSGCLFQPGFYNDAAALTAAVNACGTARFASGKYYFDFNDEQHGGDNAWHISTTLIGGEYVGGSIPGACRSPIFNDPVPGVQFVFGGNSRVTVGDTAHIELCGPSNGGEAPMTLYQQQAGSADAPVVLPAQPAGTVEQMTGGKIDPFTTVPAAATLQGALAAEGGGSLAWVSSKKDQRAAIDLRDFPGLSAVPVGAEIISAEVRLKYTKSPDAPALTLDVSGTPSITAATVPGPGADGWATVDLTEFLRTLISSGTFDASRPNLELRLPATEKSRTLTIDALSLSMSYVPPSLRAAEDAQFLYAPGGNFHGEFVVQGATYAPNGYVDLDPGSFDNALVAFRWGLVALGAQFKAQPSQEFGYPLVSLPDAGHGVGSRVTVVDLLVYVCVEQATCTSGGTHALTVRASMTDPPYTAWGSGSARPEPGRRRVEVLSWAEQR